MIDYELAEIWEKLNDLDTEVSQFRQEMKRLQTIVAKLVFSLQNQNAVMINDITSQAPAPSP